MSGTTGIVSAAPGFVNGTYDSQDVRLATMANSLPGLFAPGDFAASQRAAGANQSVDIAQGRAIVDPQVTQQGVYMVERTNAAAFNTLADGGYTWTASNGTNPRIDLLCIEVGDQLSLGSSYTGFKFRVIDGTPNASITHQLDAQFWPAITAGLLPIAAILRPTSSGSIVASNITNLNAIGGDRAAVVGPNGAAGETTTSTAYGRLATPDFAFAYVPPSGMMRVASKGLWKGPGSGIQGITLFVNGSQVKVALTETAPTIAAFEQLIGSHLGHFATLMNAAATPTSVQMYASGASTATDASDSGVEVIGYGTTGGANSAAGSSIELFGFSGGWYLVEQKYKTSAGTLTVANRRLWAEVIG